MGASQDNKYTAMDEIRAVALGTVLALSASYFLGLVPSRDSLEQTVQEAVSEQNLQPASNASVASYPTSYFNPN